MGRVFFNTRKNVHTLAANYQVLASDSGKVFMLNGAGAFTVTLPTIEAGLFYKFIALDTTADVAINSGCSAACIDLVGKDSAADLGPSTAGTAVTNLIMELAAHEGTYVNLYCDGTGWYAESMGSADASVTTS